MDKLKEQHGKKRLGDMLLERGIITEEQLSIALDIQKSTGKLLGEILVGLGFVEQGVISSVLSSDFGIQYIPSLKDIVPDPEAIKLVPKDIATKHKVVPLRLDQNQLVVVVVDPFDVVAVDVLRELTGKVITTMVAPEEEIEHAIDNWYAEEENFDTLIKEALNSIGTAAMGAEEAPVIKLVNRIILNAVKKRATDVHIEPEKNATVVRYRIDGIMYVWELLPKKLDKTIVSRVKIMSDLDISESRIPQDGKSNFFFAGKTLDLRVSTYPVLEGENVVLRILDKSNLISKIDSLGFSQKQTKILKSMLQKSYGIVLVTGPTGSGKTTTLYASLLEINSTKLNIMTIEDPVEYELPFIRQSHVNPRAGFDFARGLRSILRQDPDVIMVGEIRDSETLDVALHAALTGHLVLSTLHTNTSVAAIPRLLYMGASPNILASALAGVVAQRLVRKICPYCVEEYSPSDREKDIIKRHLPEMNMDEVKLKRGKGCSRCNGTGFIGRIPISEVFEVSDEIREAIEKQAEESEIKKMLMESGFVTMIQDGLRKALDGITTINEVVRVV